MKNYTRILFAAMLCFFICQNNVQGQALKKAMSKVKGAVSDVKGAVTDTKGAKNAVTKEQGVKNEEPSAGPAKPLAPDVKNSISEIRAFTGLTKDQFIAKMKSMGFAEGTDDMGMGMGGIVYKSKSAGYILSVKFGTRGKDLCVREISKVIYTKTPNFATIKTNFLSYGKQCTDLKAEFTNANIRATNKAGSKANANSVAERTSKFLPAFNQFFSAKEEGYVIDQYEERDYMYHITYMYQAGIAMTTVLVIDNTVESQEG